MKLKQKTRKKIIFGNLKSLTTQYCSEKCNNIRSKLLTSGCCDMAGWLAGWLAGLARPLSQMRLAFVKETKKKEPRNVRHGCWNNIYEQQYLALMHFRVLA